MTEKTITIFHSCEKTIIVTYNPMYTTFFLKSMCVYFCGFNEQPALKHFDGIKFAYWYRILFRLQFLFVRLTDGDGLMSIAKLVKWSHSHVVS